jgi:hypothetical protein
VTMSRIVVAATTLCLTVPATVKTPDTLETYQKLTSVEPRCAQASSDREILVFGARHADRWRVPFVGYDIGDPRGESVEDERKRLASEPPRKCKNEAFLRNCGMVGASVSTRLAGDGLKLRQLAP